MKLVSITSQGQLTIPKKMLRELGIYGKASAMVEKKGKTLVVKPTKSFWELGGSMFNGIKLTDKQIRAARDSFEKEWADPV